MRCPVQPYPFTLVDITGTRPPAPLAQQVGWVLGWRAPNRLITFQQGDAGIGGSIDEVNVDTGTRRVLSRFSDSSSCELGTSQGQVGDLQLATGLLDTLTVRTAGDPDRGSLLTWTLTISGGVVVVLVAGVVWTVRAIRRRRRHRASRG